MKLIVITRPDFFPEETREVISLFHAGLDTLHLRKPTASKEEVEAWILKIPAAFRSRIVLHGHFQLAELYSLKGIHLNRRHPEPPSGYTGQISRSCHSWEEVERYKKTCDYVFLSPLYDSISKPGYASAFSCQDLCQAREQGLIDSQVIALGGIDATRLPEVKSLGFGGVALLGDVWGQSQPHFLPHFRHLQRLASGSPPVVLTIAGSDSSGGAGVQADIKTISALSAYAASVITAVTAQNTQGVRGVYPIPPEMVTRQIEAVLDDLPVKAIKIGMVGHAAVAAALSDALQAHASLPLVYDPVMVSTSGHRLMETDAIDVVCRRLLPRCTLITPNLPEACLLSGADIHTIEDMEHAARQLSLQYQTAVLVKGGHLDGELMCDVLYHAGQMTHYSSPKVESRNLHGTGCTLSSAIATYLAMGNELEEAVRCAKDYVSQAIIAAKDLHIGQGHGPLWHFFA